ncbi:MAG TPA: ABC transporter ATP-binding protein [Pseudonocardiaceae bacterium]
MTEQTAQSEQAEEPLLRVRDLRVSYRTAHHRVDAVRGVSFTVSPGEVLAVVGESGSGKSTTAHALIGLLAANGRVESGEIDFAGQDLARLSERRLRAIRGRRIGLVPQDPTVSLNPVRRIGDQVAEVLLVHGLADRRNARVSAVDLLAQAGLPNPELRARQYPHELSGGMRQRVLIAIGLAARPALLIADEPTSALDATVQRHILDHLGTLTRELGTAVLLITHDLGVAADRADRIVVMSAGRIVETGPSARVLREPEHEYTRALVAAAPGRRAERSPDRRAPVGPPLLVADGLVKDYALPHTTNGPHSVRAVDGVSFSIAEGETFALVGESGSGKTTTARLVLRLTEASAGTISFEGEDISRIAGGPLRRLRSRMQLIYQNPFASLDPRFTVRKIITEPLRAFHVGDRRSRAARAAELLDHVGLPASILARRPAELSGGQRQRVAIARALSLHPKLVVCDEPVSALDVSVQAQVLDLLNRLREDLGLAYLFISHDLAVVRQVADRVAVMRHGRIVETGTVAELWSAPADPYTKELLAAVPGRV